MDTDIRKNVRCVQFLLNLFINELLNHLLENHTNVENHTEERVRVVHENDVEHLVNKISFLYN